MLEKISLRGTPCFGDDTEMTGLTTVNYVFGPNGSGKTTLSQLLTNADAVSPELSWRGNSKTIKVYNRDYVRNSFTSPEGEPGVFLLGSESKELHDQIDEKELALASSETRVQSCQNNIDTNKKTFAAKRKALEDLAWQRRSNIPGSLLDRMAGAKGSKKSCLDKVLAAADKYAAPGDEFSILEKEAETAFDDSVTEVSLFAPSPTSTIDETKLGELLLAPIVGSANVPLAALIELLDISDWVRNGRKHLQSEDNTGGLCPFCQQKAPDNLEEEFARVFNESYEEKLQSIRAIQKEVIQLEANIEQYKTTNRKLILEFADISEVDRVFSEVKTALKSVLVAIQSKLDKPSNSVEVLSISKAVEILKSLVTEANNAAVARNLIVANRGRRRASIIDRSWRQFARGLLNEQIEAYRTEEKSALRTIGGLESSKSGHETRYKLIKQELRTLRSQTTSSAKTIDAINDLLRVSQFHSFRLAESTSVKDGYVLQRDDGAEAAIESLSEGERTFITFLYFYHSLSEVTQDGESEKILAVIDDPISSLDSDIMFVVSALLRQMLDEVCNSGHSRVDQVLLLTHNTRFHNEVSYEYSGQGSNDVKFYRIRKLAPQPNLIEDCGIKNPIRTAYQELWDEVAVAETKPDETMPWLPNVLRRILESYFTTLGGHKNLYALGDTLPFAERALYQALVAWSHSGSHTIMDSFDYAGREASNSQWLASFRTGFTGKDSLGHYNMMIERARSHVIPVSSVLPM